MANLKYIGKNILNHDLILKKGDVSGSNASTGSFGNLNISKNASITGDMVVGGTLTAQEIHTEIESASIIFTSGSTLFGNTPDDTHIFTGSLLISGSISAPNLIADSASFSTRITADSSSFSTRVTLTEASASNLVSDSGSFSTRTTTLEAASASFSTRVTTAETELEETIISASAQLAEEISGSFTAPSASFSTRITNFSTGNVDLVSGSATSTGSFGTAEFADTLRVGVTTPATRFSPIHLRGAADQHSTAMATLLLEDTTSHGGIAINAPASKQTHLRFQSNGTLLWQLRMPQHDSTNPDSLRFYSYTHNNDVMTLKNDGNVGIGTIDPAERLDVVGNIQASGNISGSSTSTGSFGHVIASGDVSVTDHIQATRIGLGQTNTSNTSAVVIQDKHLEFRQPTGNDGGTGIVFSEASLGDNSFRILHNGAGSAANNTLKFLATNFHATNPYMEVFRDGKIVINEHITGDGAFISGSATSTGSFGLVLQNGNELSTFLGAAGTETLFSGSAASTGSFGRVEADSGSFDSVNTSGLITSTGGVRVTGTSKFTAHRSVGQFIEMYPDGNGSNYLQAQGNIRFAPNLGTKMILHANGRVGINTTTDAGFQFDVNGTSRFTSALTLDSTVSNISTTHVTASGNISASSFTGIFNGALSSSAQIASNISGAFAVASASFAADILSNSSSFSTRITADSSSFAARDTLSEATSSKILNGELEFTNITASNDISASGDLSIGGVSIFDSHITASGRVNLDGKVFIQSGSIEGDLHVRTNENLMRIGKSTSGVIVSGSGTVSRFATGSDGSIIDLGFTAVDEDGNVVLAGDGDGIHIDDNNYWYNNKFYKIGDGVDKFLEFDNIDMKYKGQVFASTGSFNGEMFINSPTGSMFIGKFTGGIESSGSGNISRFATGSDGSIIDLGFTTTDESGETVFLSTGDGVVVDSSNYWYTTGHFKIGDSQKQIEWNNTSLNISASTVDVTTLKASDVNFSNLPTSDPLVTGSLWVSGSSSSGSYKSGFVMISGIHG